MRSGTIALVLLGVRAPHMPHPALYAAVQHSVEMAVRAKGLQFTIASVLDGTGATPELPANLDGAILLPGREASEDMLSRLPQVPCVSVLTRRLDGFAGDYVLPDEDATGQIAFNYLFGRGHRQMAFLDAVASLPDHVARAASFRRAAQAAGLCPHMLVDAAARVPPSDEAAIQSHVETLVDQLVALSPRPTGVFVPVDIMAARVHGGLARRGVRPGTDMQLVACNNEWATFAGLDPRPATIDLRAATIGRRAVDQLIWRIGNPDEPGRMRILVEPLLVT